MILAFIMLIVVVVVGGGIYIWKLSEYDDTEDPFSPIGRIRFFKVMEKWEEQERSKEIKE
jgi:hypothetical protein